VIVDQFNVKGVCSFKTKDNAPIRPHSYRPESFQITFQRVETIPGKVESLRSTSGVKNGKNPFHSIHKIGSNSATVPAFVQSFEATVLETTNHQRTP
jgi:hypothetical protein